jgi:ribosomal protein L7Ae-like RNA K-turn-binding protein
MSKVTKLNAMRIEALKSGDKVASSIFSVLKADADKIAKKELREMTDADIEKSAKSIVKSLDESIKIKGGIATTQEQIEYQLMKFFLPEEVSPEDTINQLQEYLSGNDIQVTKANFGQVMGKVKALGVDMKVASAYLKSITEQ